MAEPPALPPSGNDPPPEPTVIMTATPDPNAQKDGGFQGQAQAAVRAAFQAIASFIANPVGDIGRAYESLGPPRAMHAGLAMGAVAAICMVLGLFLLFGRPGFSGAFVSLLRVLLLSAAVFVALVALVAGARSALGGKGRLEGDVFVAGATQLPLGIWNILAGLFTGSYEVSMAAGIFALSYATFILFGGLTKIAGVTEKRATWAVPVILVLTAWLSSVVLRAIP